MATAYSVAYSYAPDTRHMLCIGIRIDRLFSFDFSACARCAHAQTLFGVCVSVLLNGFTDFFGTGMIYVVHDEIRNESNDTESDFGGLASDGVGS